jgi:circadian clock protein KaiB
MTDDTVRLRLYIAGDAPNSLRAMANLTAFCRSHLPGRHEIEIVDVFESPARALADQVLLTPALAIVSPPQPRMIVGDLSQTGPLRQALGIGRGMT